MVFCPVSLSVLSAAISRYFAAGVALFVFLFGSTAWASQPFSLDLSDVARVPGRSLWSKTHLVGIQQGSSLSRLVSHLRSGGYELADGRPVAFEHWYKTRWTDVSLTWMTQVSDNVGILWGFSTGERGAKYTIHPSLKLGWVAQGKLAQGAYLTFRATTVLGGRLQETSCIADYGDIGGVQAVNCRLAASTLPPADTLQYLLNEKPANRTQVSLAFEWRF